MTVLCDNLTNNFLHAVPKPCLKDLIRLKIIRWYELGLRLDIERYQLELIKTNNPGDTSKCVIDMFDHWLCNSLDPSYHKLMEALCDIGEIDAASQLHNDFGK